MIKQILRCFSLILILCGLSFAFDVEQVKVSGDFMNSLGVFDAGTAVSSKLSDMSFGIEGAFCGFVDGKMIFAGGQKLDGSLSGDVYWFDISSPEKLQMSRLAEPVAFGGCFTDGREMVCVGGLTERGATAEVFTLKFRDGGIVQEKALWRLPVPLAYSGAAVLDGRIFVAGGSDKVYVLKKDTLEINALDVSELNIKSPAVVMQNKAVYVFGGTSPDDLRTSLQSVYRITYEHVEGVKIMRLLDCPVEFGQCAAAPIGQSHIFLNSKAFIDSPLVYHTITDTWVRFDQDMPAGEFTAAAKAGDAVVFAGADGIYKAVVSHSKSLMRPFDYVVIGLYLSALVWIGCYFSKREKSTESFFVGGRKMPAWAVACSIFAAGTSGISFMAIPAKSYMTNLVFFGAVLISVGFTVTLAFIIPYFRRLEITSIYEYLEMRFDPVIRLIGASVCLIYQIGARISITMYIPALALTTVTGFDIRLSIIIMGVLATVYTALGGVEAVIWADVLQSFVMIIGALVAVVVLLMGTTGGITGYVDLNAAYDKFKMFDLRWDYTLPVVWIMAANCFFVMIQTLTDQTTLQRVFCTSNPVEAKRSMLISVAIGVTMAVIFWGIGTMLFSYFKSNPGSLAPSLPDDSAFPLFIVKKIPVGLCGLVIAGLFSAAMSTLDSSMNSVSSVVVTDFYSKINPGASEKAKMLTARYTTVLVGVVGTGFALILAASNIQSIFDIWMSLAGLLLSALPAVMLLGLFTKRTSRVGAYISIGASIIAALCVKSTPMHFFLYGFTILTVAAISGYLSSFVFKEKRDLTGLTFWMTK